MKKVLSPIQEGNIQTYLQAMPADIQANIEECKEKWLNNESAYGYPHPAQVCESIQAYNARQQILTVQQTLDLQILKIHLRQAI
ncbi:hypothetical protein QYF50_06490 [Paenibacillus vini]|uniref:hypothetical protein n=1 Tax=Paenibacillus vini TaxID=1476024 RepID=UPI0025B72172|nr:hypothetical protein [Paenibacillus vini]MDN4067539.1 hypothetical protein [Paenibacillus vini]